MITYNPFEKELSRLRRKDLQKLIENEVAEGWYVEYKVDFPSAKKIGHSIASFANTDGGWLIIGVRANENNIADTIVGFDRSTHRGPKEKIRNIISTHISPTPFFKMKVIELLDKKRVLVVLVERGDETPYVTKDGRIYRRVGEGSDPIPENDRYSLQKLFERSAESKERIEDFTINPFSISQAQAGSQPFLEVYFYNQPFDSYHIKGFFKKEFFEKLKEVFTSSVPFIVEPSQASIQFNSFYASSRSYILRQIPTPEVSTELVLSLELFPNSNIRMFIPISLIEHPKHRLCRESDFYQTFLESLSESEFDRLKIVDGYGIFISFTILFNQYCKLLESYHFRGNLRARLRFTNTWRSLIYFDSQQYIDFIKDYGLPICLKDQIEIPEFYGGRGIRIGLDQRKAFFLIGLMFEALGFPLSLVPESMYELGDYIAGLSASIAQNSQ